MLEHSNAIATIAVRDMDVSRKFYEEKLGFKPLEVRSKDVVKYTSGDTFFYLYKSEHAGTHQATAAAWYVETDLETIVAELNKRGVKFDVYDGLQGIKPQKGLVHLYENVKVAWVKDPDGNILALVCEDEIEE